MEKSVMSNKQFFIDRYEKLGQELKFIVDKSALRVNTLKISHEELIKRLESLGVSLEKIDFTINGYYFKCSKFSLGAITEFLLGYYYLQESVSQVPVEILDPKENETVLDSCASPGGKTTQIAELMNNKGTLIALEFKQHRLISLKNSLERLGVENCVVYNLDARNVKSLNLEFDKILLDAPCSGNYVTDKNWFEKRTIDGIKKSSEIQKKLLKACCDVLKVDGIMIYSTCSLEPEENELNIDWTLKNLPLKLEQINLPIGDDGLINVFGQKLNQEIKTCKRFWPWKTNTGGFFIAKLRKC